MATPSLNYTDCILRGFYQAGGNLREGDDLEDPDVGGKIIF